MKNKINKHSLPAWGALLCFSAAIILLVLINSCSQKETLKPGTNQVFMQNMAFTPPTITVTTNTTVTWTNQDNMTHTVTSDNNLFNSGDINPGATYSRQFTTAGTFSYHCTIHPSMTGTIVVQTGP